jgi:hypothetical protein
MGERPLSLCPGKQDATSVDQDQSLSTRLENLNMTGTFD